MAKFDLTQYQCPQLFVQFKYQLKLSMIDIEQNNNSRVVEYSISVESDIKDIERYLNSHQYSYQIVSLADNNELIVSLIKGNN